MRFNDVLVVTPYNAQVSTIAGVLPGIRVGTVDKFQGQEAPISIYSMATSSAEDAPRGMEFLYSLNRLNVATSRARCLAVVVASPDLIRVRCPTGRDRTMSRIMRPQPSLIPLARSHLIGTLSVLAGSPGTSTSSSGSFPRVCLTPYYLAEAEPFGATRQEDRAPHLCSLA